jgi:hypothetical protein
LSKMPINQGLMDLLTKLWITLVISLNNAINYASD